MGAVGGEARVCGGCGGVRVGAVGALPEARGQGWLGGEWVRHGAH